MAGERCRIGYLFCNFSQRFSLFLFGRLLGLAKLWTLQVKEKKKNQATEEEEAGEETTMIRINWKH